jgi:hypothetical protein
MRTSQKLSADWTRVLARVETALAAAVGQLQSREKVLSAGVQVTSIVKSLDFAKFEDRLAAFAASPKRAEQRLAAIDGALAEAEEALRHWLSRADATRRKLAAWLGSGGPKGGF